MTQLHEIYVKLTDKQKFKLMKAHDEGKTIVLRLSKDSLHGPDILHVPETTKIRLEERRKLMKGMDIKFPSIKEDNIINRESIILQMTEKLLSDGYIVMNEEGQLIPNRN